MTLPWPSSNANPLIYASAVASWLSQVIGYDPGFGIQQDPEFYEKILRDDTCSAALDKLQKLVVGHDYFHQPRGDTYHDWLQAQVLDELTQETQDLKQSLYNLAAASWKGAAWAEFRLAKKILRLGDGRPRLWTVLAEAKDVDKRRLRLTRAAVSPVTLGRDRALRGDAFGRGLAGPAVGSRWRWEFNRGYGDERNTASWYVPLSVVAPLDRWCCHRVDTSERGLAYGYGLAEDLYFSVYARAAVIRNLLQGIDRWGQGFLVQSVPGLRAGGTSGATPEQKIAQVVATLRKYRAGNVYAKDKEDELDLLDGPAEAIQACMGVVNYFDDRITQRVLHATRTSGGSAKEGAFAQAKVEEDSEDANVAFLRAPLEERWTRTATRLLVKENRHNFAALGCPDFLSVSSFRMRGRKLADPQKAAVAIETMAKLGLPILKKEVYDLLEFTRPRPWDKAEDVFSPAEARALASDLRPEVGARLPEAREQAAEDRSAKVNGDRRAVGAAGGSVAQDRGDRRAVGAAGGSVAQDRGDRRALALAGRG